MRDKDRQIKVLCMLVKALAERLVKVSNFEADIEQAEMTLHYIEKYHPDVGSPDVNADFTFSKGGDAA